MAEVVGSVQSWETGTAEVHALCEKVLVAVIAWARFTPRKQVHSSMVAEAC